MSTDTLLLPGPPPLLERLQMLKDLIPLPFVLMLAPFKRENRGRSWRRAAYDSALRYVASRRWNLRQNLVIFGTSSTEAYEKWARKQKMESITDEIEEDAQLLWVGPRRHDRVLLWLHGGGFCLPIDPNQHLTFLSDLQTTFEDAKTPVGVAVLAYSLTPSSPFPTQLRQSTAAVKHLLAKGVSPSNLVIGGDSAGGNLALQLLSHALHPFPDIPPPPTFSLPLAGVLLISHWASFRQDFPSFKRNDKKDNINCETIATFMTVSARGIEPGQEQWFEPMASHVEWWRGLGGLVGRMMSTVGEIECLRDPIEEFAKTRLGPNVEDLVCLVEKNGVHTDFLCDIAVGEGENNAAHRDVVSWLQDTFCKP